MAAKLYPIRAESGAQGGRPRILRWRVTFRDADGKRRFRNVDTPDRDTAQRIADQLQAEALLLRHGVTTRAEKTTVAAAWLAFCKARATMVGLGELRQSTVEADEELWSRYGHHFEPLRLSELTQATVARILSELRTVDRPEGFRGTPPPVSSGVKWQVERLLTKLVHWCALRGDFGDDADWRKPWSRKRLGLKKPKPRAWKDPEPETLARILPAAMEAGGAQLRLAALIQLAGGHRRGELQHLRWGDHLYRVDGGWRLYVEGRHTKTGGDHASMFAGELARVVDDWEREHARLAPSSPWVFPVTRAIRSRGRVVRAVGEQRSTYVMSDAQWKRLCAAAGLEGWRVHDLRRAFARTLAHAGHSMRFIQTALVHSSMQVTEGYMRGHTRAAELEVSKAFEGILGGAAPPPDADPWGLA